MSSKLARSIGTALVMGGALLAVQPAASASTQVTQSYSCAGQIGNVTIVAKAKESEKKETISLTGVKFALTNSFGVPITADHVQINVADPSSSSAPYLTGSAAVGLTPAGWTANHGSSGVFALHAGSVTLASGAVVSNAVLSAKYKDTGSTGTVINFVGGAITLNVTSPAVGPVTCTPNSPVVVFAHIAE